MADQVRNQAQKEKQIAETDTNITKRAFCPQTYRDGNETITTESDSLAQKVSNDLQGHLDLWFVGEPQLPNMDAHVQDGAERGLYPDSQFQASAVSRGPPSSQ
ncbi:Hypothetical predicted protein [Marmota monax]|uniref:Uncharacterized protein n=1 Tax=Marmota monax TaxID=9995 RepID=A0A5E4AHH9_MARMO|nr:hypothetical protein GHT09_000221 [Marmota monax]VTJ55912.1 Hypothetical predicted protein [Marmota monax]